MQPSLLELRFYHLTDQGKHLRLVLQLFGLRACVLDQLDDKSFDLVILKVLIDNSFCALCFHLRNSPLLAQLLPYDQRSRTVRIECEGLSSMFRVQCSRPETSLNFEPGTLNLERCHLLVSLELIAYLADSTSDQNQSYAHRAYD